jgi:hypothetical protein
MSGLVVANRTHIRADANVKTDDDEGRSLCIVTGL